MPRFFCSVEGDKDSLMNAAVKAQLLKQLTKTDGTAASVKPSMKRKIAHHFMSQFSPSKTRSSQQVEGRRDKKQESFSECAQRNKKWHVQVCDVALYEVVRSVWCCARYNNIPSQKREDAKEKMIEITER